jgi:hypothetical protein
MAQEEAQGLALLRAHFSAEEFGPIEAKMLAAQSTQQVWGGGGGVGGYRGVEGERGLTSRSRNLIRACCGVPVVCTSLACTWPAACGTAQPSGPSVPPRAGRHCGRACRRP